MSLNPAQLLYCVQQLALDNKEHSEEGRARIEYMAMFINADAVKEVQERRSKETDEEREESSKAFEDFVESEFGTPIDIDEIRVVQPIGDGTIKSSFGINPEDYVPAPLKKPN